MNRTKVSVLVPYWRRIDNLSIMLEGLTRQSLDSSEFELVVGTTEYSEEYVAVCRKYADRLRIVTVMSEVDSNIPRARNMAMRQAGGEVVVQMDVDTLLPPDALRDLYDRHFSFGQRVCVVGQVVGYGNNEDGDVDTVEALPYERYRPGLEALVAATEPEDPRFQVPHIVPWAFAWTGLIALPAATVREHDLYFDESFRGWGVDDLEWGLRISESGIPIVLRSDVRAIHLPHVRKASVNRESERANYLRFLRKWPRPDVELAYVFGDVAANSLYGDFVAQGRRAAGEGCGLGTLHGHRDGVSIVVLGVPLVSSTGEVADRALLETFDGRVETWPLAGLATPYSDGQAETAYIHPAITAFAEPFRGAVHREARRVARTVSPRW